MDCIRERRPIIHNDYASLPYRKGLPEGHAPVVRELVVPIFRNGKIVAILGVGNKATDYVEDDVGAMTYLADVAWEIAQRKLVERDLRESEERLGRIFNSLANGIAFTEPESGRILSVNDTWVQDTGISRDDAVGRTALELGLWGSNAERIACVETLAREGRLREFEAALVLRGVRRQFSLNAEFVDMQGGRFLLWELRDISERKRADEEIAMLKHSIDGHSDAAYWFGSDGRFSYVNREGCRALGYEPGELIGKSILDVNRDATSERMQTVWDKLRSEGAFRAEAVHRRKDGSEFPAEILTSYVQFGGQEYACGFARDITQRKAAEQKLAVSEERFRKLFEESPIGIAILGQQREITLTNQRYRDFLGLSEDEIIRRGPVGILHPDDWEPSLALSAKLRGGEISLFHMEQRYLRSDGQVVWSDTHITPVRDQGGQVLHTIGWVQDITERKRAEEEKAKLRSPVAPGPEDGIGGPAGGRRGPRLQQHAGRHPRSRRTGAGGDRTRRSRFTAILRKSSKAAERSADLTRQLLAFARKQTIAPKVLDLNETVAGMLKMLQRLIGEDIDLVWLPGARPVAGQDGPVPDRPDPGQPVRQRPRRHRRCRQASPSRRATCTIDEELLRQPRRGSSPATMCCSR